MASFAGADFGGFRRNALVLLLMAVAFIGGVLVGIGPLSKYSPINRPVVNWEGLVLSEIVDKLAIDVKLEDGDVAGSRKFLSDRVETQIGYLSGYSDAERWNVSECDKLKRVHALMGDSSRFNDVRRQVIRLKARFCEKRG